MIDTLEVDQLQREIMELGERLVAVLPDSISEYTRKEIKDFFSHNEYGEAMYWLSMGLQENHSQLSGEAKILTNAIENKMKCIEGLYESSQN